MQENIFYGRLQTKKHIKTMRYTTSIIDHYSKNG